MEDLAKQFVRGREALVSEGSGWRVPASLRSLAVGYGRWALAEGDSVGAAAVRLGLSRATLVRWLAESPDAESLSEWREVVIREPELSPTPGPVLTLVTPEGFRIEGLDSPSLVGLLRALR
jgi:hypothetical protein